MISGVNTQAVNFGAVTKRDGQQTQVVYIPQGEADSVEISGKKGKKAKKTILATIGTAAVAAAALFLGVKSGKLKKIDNPTNILGKLQNLGYAAGSKVGTAVSYCANSKVGTWCKEKCGPVVDKIKEKATPVLAKLKEKGAPILDKVKGFFTKKA